MKKYKVALVGEMPAQGYSGGRYVAWTMAEALAEQENEVFFVTNYRPEFSEDFVQYKRHDRIQVILTRNFYDFDLSEKELDYVICIPALRMGKKFYQACVDFSIKKKARFAFINFETPNWYNLYAEMNRSEEDFLVLKEMCKYGALVISISKEGEKYAKEYYNQHLSSTAFTAWLPPINSLVADEIQEEKKNQVMVFLRVQDKHKGGNDFLQLLGEYLRGMTCVCIVGIGKIPEDFLAEATEKAKKYGIELRFETGLNDRDKFIELKRSKLLLFPSHFEGYGIPPVEALYCGTKCVVYDLPVLREVSGEALIYSERNNIQALRKQAEKMLQTEDIAPTCVDSADFNKQATRLQEILDLHFNDEKLKKRRNSLTRMFAELRIWNNSKNSTKQKLVPNIIKECITENSEISKLLPEKSQKWSVLKKELKGKKVFIWGCGRAYKELYPKYRKKVFFAGIIDGNPSKIGTPDRVSDRYYIQGPEALKGINQGEVAVLISNKEHVDDIIASLKELGVTNYYSMCMVERNTVASKLYGIFRKR